MNYQGELTKINLAVDLAGLKLRYPIMNASGVLGISAPLLKKMYNAGAGAVITKSLGPESRLGHPNPTVVEVEGGLLNSMGLPNPGVDYFLSEIKHLKNEGIPIVASFFASTIDDFIKSSIKLEEAGAQALELNLSCPNVGGESGMCASDPVSTEKITKAIKNTTKLPLFVKLSPNVTDIVPIAIAAESGGADAITATNTLKGMSIDIDFKKPILSNIMGGLSGSALKPVSLRFVWEMYENIKIPIIGCGGIFTWRDAIEYFLAGARAIEIGTAIMLNDYKIFHEINEGIARYLSDNDLKDIKEIIGLAHKS
ncbi:dihydroorotate dehydrogenase [Candidatus Bathyarchaeota archaeon]|nr:dihydroorotate dehydrogenase [Candidatus Bathyarchaeota archaeon]